ncbi:MAG: PDZ domain-containing protein [Thermoguttaceae bacterium]
MRLHCSTLIRLVVLPLFYFILGGVVLAQTTLDRLEQQIRQRVSPSQGGTSVYRSGATGPASSVPSPPPAPSPDNITNNPAPVYLGMTADDRKDRGRGVRITEVRPGGPAEKAGLLKQDLITALAGTRVRQLSDLTEILGVYQPADVVEFDILRDGAAKKIKVTLGRPPAAPGPVNQTAEMIPLPPGELILPDPGTAKTTAPPAKTIPTPAPKNSPSDRETIEQLRNHIAELERRISELERELAEAQKNK